LKLTLNTPSFKNSRKRTDTDSNDKTLKDLIWLIFDTSLLTSGFSLEEPSSFAGRIHRMIKLGLQLGDAPTPAVSTADDIPDLEDEATEESRMEEVD